MAHPDGRLADYFASLQALAHECREHEIVTLLPGHGPPLDDPHGVVEAYLQQAREYDEALEKSSRFVRTMQGRMLADATHPLPIRRVAELDRFARSAQYSRILAKGERLDVE